MKNRFHLAALAPPLIFAIFGCTTTPPRERGWIGGDYADLKTHCSWAPRSHKLKGELPNEISQTRSRAVLVRQVFDATPAATAGIRSGDLVFAVDGVDVTSATDFYDAIDARAPGDTVRLRISRAGTESEIDVDVGTERYKDWGRLILGFESPLQCDLFPNRDFNLFGLLGWEFTNPRRELRRAADRARWSAQGHVEPPEKTGLSGWFAGNYWKYRIGLFTVSRGPDILQQTAAPRA